MWNRFLVVKIWPARGSARRCGIVDAMLVSGAAVMGTVRPAQKYVSLFSHIFCSTFEFYGSADFGSVRFVTGDLGVRTTNVLLHATGRSYCFDVTDNHLSGYEISVSLCVALEFDVCLCAHSFRILCLTSDTIVS